MLGWGDVGGGIAQEGVQVVTGLGGAVCQRGDTWGGGERATQATSKVLGECSREQKR